MTHRHLVTSNEASRIAADHAYSVLGYEVSVGPAFATLGGWRVQILHRFTRLGYVMVPTFAGKEVPARFYPANA